MTAIYIPRVADFVKAVKPWTLALYDSNLARQVGIDNGYRAVQDIHPAPTIYGFFTFPEGSLFKVFNYNLKKTAWMPIVILTLHETTDSLFLERTPGGRKVKTIKIRFESSLEDFSNGCLEAVDK